MVIMDLILKKKEELEALIGNVSEAEKQKVTEMMQQLLETCMKVNATPDSTEEPELINAETSASSETIVKESTPKRGRGRPRKCVNTKLDETKDKALDNINSDDHFLEARKNQVHSRITRGSPKKIADKKSTEHSNEETSSDETPTVRRTKRKPKIVNKDLEKILIKKEMPEEMKTNKDQSAESDRQIDISKKRKITTDQEPQRSPKKGKLNLKTEHEELKDSANLSFKSPEKDDYKFSDGELEDAEFAFEPDTKKSKKRKRRSTKENQTQIGVPKQVSNMKCLEMFEKCFLCQNGDQEYTSIDLFKKHIEKDHFQLNSKNKTVIKCTCCIEKYYLVRPPDGSMVLRNLIDILIHFVRVHPNAIIDFTSDYQCPRCEYRSNEKTDWIAHVQAHLSEKVKCEKCDKLVAQNSLNAHMKNVHDKDASREFPCEHCGKFYVSPAQVKYHVERIHLKTKNFKCTLCDAAFFYKFDLERHLFVWHKQESASHPVETCGICGFQTLSGNLMNKHMANHETGEFTCPHCPKTFETKNRLRSHVAMHTSTSMFSCQECDYTTRKKNHLERHMTFTHGGVLYQCDLCTFKGTTERGILTHYSRVHGETGASLSDFRKIQLVSKPDFSSRKRRSKSDAAEHTARPSIKKEKTASDLAYIQAPPANNEISEVLTKVEQITATENTGGVEEITCVMTGETNEDGTPVILAVREDGVNSAVTDLEFVQNMLQLNADSLSSVNVNSITEQEGEGVTVYQIVHAPAVPETEDN